MLPTLDQRTWVHNTGQHCNPRLHPHKHTIRCLSTRLHCTHPNTASGTYSSASRSQTESTASHINTGCHTPYTNSVRLHLAAYTHTHRHTLSLSLRGQIPSGEASGPPGGPLAPLHFNHDFVIVNTGKAGSLGAARTGFLAGATPTPTPGPGRPGIPGTSWTWQAAPSRLP